MTRLFAAKAWIAGTGLVAGVAGMLTGRRALVAAAVVLLAVAFVLRFAERKTDAP